MAMSWRPVGSPCNCRISAQSSRFLNPRIESPQGCLSRTLADLGRVRGCRIQVACLGACHLVVVHVRPHTAVAPPPPCDVLVPVTDSERASFDRGTESWRYDPKGGMSRAAMSVAPVREIRGRVKGELSLMPERRRCNERRQIWTCYTLPGCALRSPSRAWPYDFMPLVRRRVV